MADEPNATDTQLATRPDDPNSTVHAPPIPSPEMSGGVPGYVVLSELGRGGMGVVFKALQTRLNRMVALKMILGGTDALRVTRFLAEAEAVAASQHPNVVQVYECGEYAGRPFIALEYLPGGTLADRLRTGPLALANAATLVAQIAAGVQAAHAQGIVHRDLKPSNILFEGDRGQWSADRAEGKADTATGSSLTPVPKVTDFGIARRGGSDLTATGSLLGTPAYMAPEQARGDTKFVGPAADVWALGAILYECLTGKRPFEGDDPLSVLGRIQTQPPPPLRSLVPRVPRDLELVCLKCLEKDARDRYPTAAALADDLERFLRGESVSVRTSGPVERAVKWARRNKGLATGLAVAVMALVVGSIVSVAFGLRSASDAEISKEARKAAEQSERDATKARDQAEANLREAVVTTASFILVARELEETLGNNTVMLARLLRQTEMNLERLRKAGDSVEVREQQAALQALAAQYHLNQGRTDRALLAAEEAVAGYKMILHSGRESTETRAGLWYAYSARAEVHYARGTTTPALEDAEQALKLAEELAGSGEARWENLRARSLTQVGKMFWARGYFPEGDQRHEEALRLRIRMAQSPAADTPEYRRQLARAYHNRGTTLARRDEPGATAAYRKAYELLEPLAAGSATAQFELAETCIPLANDAQKNGDTKAAVGYLDTAARLCAGLLQADSGNGERQRLNIHVRLSRSQIIPAGLDVRGLMREQLTLLDATILISQQYVNADPENAVWRSRLSGFRKLRAMHLTALNPNPAAPEIRQEVENLVATAWDEDRKLAAADPDSFYAATDAQKSGAVVLLVRGWVKDGPSAHTIRETSLPQLEFYARRVAREPGRAEWRIGVGEVRLDTVRSYVFAQHRAEAEAECRVALAELEPAKDDPKALRLRAEFALRLGHLRLEYAEKTQPINKTVVTEAAEAFRQAVAILEPRVTAAPADEESRRLLIRATMDLAFSLELQGRNAEATEVRLKNRTLRLNVAIWQLVHKTYLPRQPQFVTEGVAGNAFGPRWRKETAQLVRDAERQFQRTPSADAAVDLMEAYLKAAHLTEGTEGGRSEVIDYLNKILGVYKSRADAGHTHSVEEQRLVKAVHAAIEELTRVPELAPPPRERNQ